jgi:hypothetical protein
MPYDACTPSRRIRVPSKFSTLGHQVCRWLAKELVAFLYPVKASDQSNGTGSRYIEMNEQHCSSHSQKENQGGGWHLGTMPLCFVLSGRHSLSRSVTWYALDRRMTRAHACSACRARHRGRRTAQRVPRTGLDLLPHQRCPAATALY